jgi:hypothetical protein
VTDEELELRRRIMRSFAETGAPPPLGEEDPAVVEALADARVIVLGEDGEVRMAHPFANHDEGAIVESGGRRWRGNCAWDGFGIAAALRLVDYTVTSNGVTADDTVLFHVTVPAEHWWDDPGYT